MPVLRLPPAPPAAAPAVTAADAAADADADADARPDAGSADDTLSIEDAHVWWALAAMLLGSLLLWGLSVREHPAPSSPGEAYVQERIEQYRQLRRGAGSRPDERCLAARQVWLFYAGAGADPGASASANASASAETPLAREWAATVGRECARS